MNKKYLTPKGYAQYLQDIKDKEAALHSLCDGTGKRAIDEFDTDLELERVKLANELVQLRNEEKSIVIIQPTQSKDVVSLGDTVTVEQTKKNGNSRTRTFVLVGHKPDLESSIGEVSINSPLGRAVYHHKVGDAVSVTTQNGEVTQVVIKDRVAGDELEKTTNADEGKSL